MTLGEESVYWPKEHIWAHQRSACWLQWEWPRSACTSSLWWLSCPLETRYIVHEQIKMLAYFSFFSQVEITCICCFFQCKVGPFISLGSLPLFARVMHALLNDFGSLPCLNKSDSSERKWGHKLLEKLSWEPINLAICSWDGRSSLLLSLGQSVEIFKKDSFVNSEVKSGD